MIGQQLGGWQLLAVLGEGTQGTVYAARHTELPREAAIKMLLPRLARDRARVERFFDEARAAGSIHHPGVVEVYDCGRDSSGRIYIAMERLLGETLHARLRRAPPPLGESLMIVRQVAEALGAAHDAGIVHRDLKPENVFLAHEAGEVRVKIVDFGIAKLAPEMRGAGTLTGAGLFGTPPYMSPEQCSGTDPIDHRTDLYALGCLLHELATGTPPFGFEGVAELVEAHREEPAPALSSGCPDVPEALDDLAARLLAKLPADRPASAREVIDVIDRIGLAATIAPAAADLAAPMAPTVVPQRGWRAAAWHGALELEPWIVAGISCLAGCCLLALAIVTGVGDSYGASNWAVTFMVLVPLILSFQLKAMQRSDAALGELARRGMLRARSGFDAGAHVRASAHRLGARLIGFGVVCCIPAIPVSIAEWHHRWRTLPIVGAWWTESPVLGIVGGIFQGVLISTLLVFIVHSIAWTQLLQQLTLPRGRVRLIIDPTASDPRRGFEIFEGPVVLTLVTGLLVQLALYLSNVQHFAEIRGQTLLSVIAPSLDLFGRDGLLDTGAGRYPSMTTLLASVLVVSFMITSGVALWRTARDVDGDGAARQRWPILGIGPVQILVLLALAAIGTIFYRLGPAVLVILALAIVRAGAATRRLMPELARKIVE